MIARLKKNRTAQILLAATFIFACVICLALGGAGAFLSLQSSPAAPASSKLASPTPARPATSPTATPTDPSSETSVSDPTAPAATADQTVELSDAAKTSYLSLLLLEGTTVMLEETAAAVQTGQADEFETMGRLLAIGAFLKATGEAIQEPAPDPAMQPAWEAGRQAAPLIRQTIKQWLDGEITSAEIPAALEAARTHLNEALALAEAVLVGYGLDQARLTQLRQETMASLREEMASDAGDETVSESSTAVAENGAATAEAVPTATPSGPSLEILSMSDYVDSIDYLHVVGEIENVSDRPYHYVEVVVTLYDQAGQVVDTNFSYTDLDILLPGQKAPFEVTFDQYAGTSEYRAQVQGRPANSLPYAGLVVKNTGEHVDSINYWHLVGEVANEGDASAEFVQVVATLYDEAGTVVGTAFTFTELDTLSPGATSPFELTVGDEIDFARYLVQVQGRVR